MSFKPVNVNFPSVTPSSSPETVSEGPPLPYISPRNASSHASCSTGEARNGWPEPLRVEGAPGRTDQLHLHGEPEQTRRTPQRVRFPFLPTSHRISDGRKRVWCPGRHEVREPEAAGLVLKVSAAYGNEHRKVTIVVFCWFLLKNAEKRKVTRQRA